jgi:methylglutaconyl-CoA hydratase
MMKNIKVTQNQQIVTVSLNRPEKRNAFQPEMIHELTKAFKGLAKEKSVRAVLLTGEGESFCAGGDLAWMKSMAKYTLQQNIKDAGQLFDMYWAIRSCPVPVIGKVFGHCFGGGAGLAAVCDITAAEIKTQFCFSEVKWGLVPAVISPFVAERAHATWVREWFLTARVFLANDAMMGGLVNFEGNQTDVDDFIEQTLMLILGSAPAAVRATKALHQSYSPIDWKKTRAKVTKIIAQRRVSDEGQAGLQAFLNKQTPKWNEPNHGAPAKI